MTIIWNSNKMLFFFIAQFIWSGKSPLGIHILKMCCVQTKLKEHCFRLVIWTKSNWYEYWCYFILLVSLHSLAILINRTNIWNAFVFLQNLLGRQRLNCLFYKTTSLHICYFVYFYLLRISMSSWITYYISFHLYISFLCNKKIILSVLQFSALRNFFHLRFKNMDKPKGN